VALVNDGSFYVGPHIARALAHKGFNLVVGDPADALVDDLRGRGVDVAVVEGVRDLTRSESAVVLVDAAMSSFGRLDSAEMFSGRLNAVGTNFMDFPEFLKASGATDPEVRKKIESQVPLGRLGTLDEFASFCMPYLDGTSRFATGQFVAFAGGWA